MSGERSDDPILWRIRTSLRAIYGNRIERLVLFGSRARGDAHEDSDYDIAVFLEDLTDRWPEFHRLADLRTEILAETSAFLEARPFRAGSYRDRTPLMHEIRRDGVDLRSRKPRNIRTRRDKRSEKRVRSPVSNSPKPLARLPTPPRFTPHRR